MKRYSIAKVFRKNPVGAGHPRELFECDYDIVSAPGMRLVHDAEVMKVLPLSLHTHHTHTTHTHTHIFRRW